MSFKYTVAACLEDIIENADQIQKYIASLDRARFEVDRLKRDAVERCLERVCEAAHRLGERASVLMPEQPWAKVRGLGNWLRHGYDRLDPEILWNTVSKDLPSLIEAAKACLSATEGSA